jgi:hypothetical protein
MPIARNPPQTLIGRTGRLLAHLLLAVVFVAMGAAPLPAAGIKGLDRIEENLLSREVLARSRSFVASAAALEESLDEFRHFVNLSERAGVRAAIRELDQIEELHRKLEVDAGALGDYLAENRKRLSRQGLGHLLPLLELTGTGYKRFNEALGDYISARRELFVWTEEHFREISGGDEAARKQYDKLYRRCEESMEKEYDRYLDRIQFINAFRQDHPELAEYVAK